MEASCGLQVDGNQTFRFATNSRRDGCLLRNIRPLIDVLSKSKIVTVRLQRVNGSIGRVRIYISIQKCYFARHWNNFSHLHTVNQPQKIPTQS